MRESDSYLLAVLICSAVSADFCLFILLRLWLTVCHSDCFYLLLFVFADVFIAVPAEAVSTESTVLVAA
jgi:hypothetical protein